jgi:hypothetical protein
MIGSSGTYVPLPHDAPTGGYDLYERVAYSYYQMGPSKAEPLDPRKNPKNWALWFREFLALIFPRVRMEVMTPAEPTLPRLAYRCRSGTTPVREWKMKNWVQALKSQQI